MRMISSVIVSHSRLVVASTGELILYFNKRRKPHYVSLKFCTRGIDFDFRQCIVIGETAFTAGAVRELIKSLGQEYRGDRYHLISRNCNHFSAVLAKVSVELTGKGFEAYV